MKETMWEKAEQNGIFCRRRVRQYSVFEKVDGRWVQITRGSLPKEDAVRAFQSILLGGAMSGRKLELRPIKG